MFSFNPIRQLIPEKTRLQRIASMQRTRGAERSRNFLEMLRYQFYSCQCVYLCMLYRLFKTNTEINIVHGI